MELWDTHCHLNDPSFAGRTDEILVRAQTVGVCKIVVPAYDMASIRRTWALASDYPATVLPAIGLHPWFIGDEQQWDGLSREIQRPECRAVGEIGVDGYAGSPPKALQMWWFERQLELAVELKLPALIHCRRAFPELLRVLKRFRGAAGLILHAFAGSPELARQLVRLGAYISFAGALTLDNARKALAVALVVPEDRLLLETDAPSIGLNHVPAPEVEPAHLLRIAQRLAQVRGCGVADIARISTENARRVFGGS